MTPQDRFDIVNATIPYGVALTDGDVDRLEAVVTAARAAVAASYGYTQNYLLNAVHRRDTLIRALLRSRRIDRAALAAVNDTLGSLTGWVGPDTDRLVIVIQERMADAERTTREENRNA